MVSKQIIEYKCIINVCDIEFGVFCRERDSEEKKRFGRQQGATNNSNRMAFEFAFADGDVAMWWHGGLVTLVLLACVSIGIMSWEGAAQCSRLWWRWAFWEASVLVACLTLRAR